MSDPSPATTDAPAAGAAAEAPEATPLPPREGPCPCGSGDAAEACCMPILRGDAPAETAEAMLRARYTAYVVGAVDFIVETHHTRTRGDLQREGVEAWSKESTWLGLTVQEKRDGGPGDETGYVRFRARYKQRGTTFDHLEDAQFEREGGKWRFVDATTPPYKHEAKKPGRNELCPCGSGKKFKKCCAA